MCHFCVFIVVVQSDQSKADDIILSPDCRPKKLSTPYQKEYGDAVLPSSWVESNETVRHRYNYMYSFCSPEELTLSRFHWIQIPRSFGRALQPSTTTTRPSYIKTKKKTSRGPKINQSKQKKQKIHKNKQHLEGSWYSELLE